MYLYMHRYVYVPMCVLRVYRYVYAYKTRGTCSCQGGGRLGEVSHPHLLAEPPAPHGMQFGITTLPWVMCGRGGCDAHIFL